MKISGNGNGLANSGLIPPISSAKGIFELKTLLASAQRGEIFGMAYAAPKPAREYDIRTTGVHRAHPSAAQGAVSRLLNHPATR